MELANVWLICPRSRYDRKWVRWYLTLRISGQVISEQNTCGRMVRVGNNPPRWNNNMAVSFHI